MYFSTKLKKNQIGSYTCTFGGGSERTEICFLARALRNFFPKKLFNYTLIDLTICFLFSYVCMVCISNPSLVTGLSYTVLS